MRIVGLICARGGSKGLPRKNLRLLAGKPLVGWAIGTALACPSLNRVVVSTEDAEIAAVARAYGADVPFVRPAELARDDAAEWLVWRHAIRALEADGERLEALVAVPPTAPLRQPEDVEACVAALLQSDADAAITVKPAERNPYFNMVTLKGGFAELAVKALHAIHRRQDAPVVFDITTVAYAVRPALVLEGPHLFAGRVRAVLVPPERAVDIDSELDLAWAEFLLARQARS